jgi:hypothetical protein
MMATLLLGWLALAGTPAEAACRAIDPSCRGTTTQKEAVMMVQSPQDWDRPLRSIYQGYLEPLFASCNCPFFGIEEMQSWNDPDDQDLHWWLIHVVLGFSSGEGWQMKVREYLFSARGTDNPILASLGMEQSWPSDLGVIH